MVGKVAEAAGVAVVTALVFLAVLLVFAKLTAKPCNCHEQDTADNHANGAVETPAPAASV